MSPHPEARRRALAAYPGQRSRWHAQLAVYLHMRDEDLLCAAQVALLISARDLVSRPHVRVTCAQCGEEIMNERERIVNGRALCRHCAGESYFSSPHDFGWHTEEAVSAAIAAGRQPCRWPRPSFGRRILGKSHSERALPRL